MTDIFVNIINHSKLKITNNMRIIIKLIILNIIYLFLILNKLNNLILTKK